MLVLPGGGYECHAEHEREPIAEYFSSLGIFSATLNYRLGPKHQHPAMLSDALRAIRTIRFHAAEWGVDPKRVGVIGFSAGGHLAATASVHSDVGDPHAPDPVERMSSKPDLALLIYALLEMEGEYSSANSRRNLLGENASSEMIHFMTSRNHVTADTPPTLLVTAVDDLAVPVENTLHYALALSAAKVPYELLAYKDGGHGFGLGSPNSIAGQWPSEAAKWLRSYGHTS